MLCYLMTSSNVTAKFNFCYDPLSPSLLVPIKIGTRYEKQNNLLGRENQQKTHIAVQNTVDNTRLGKDIYSKKYRVSIA